MPRYHHPAAVNDDLPTPPQAVTVGGDTVPVEVDGTFTAASDAVVRPVADAYDMAVSDLRADSDAPTASDDLGDMTHGELKERATELGIADDTDLRSKESIRDAIRDAE